MDQGNRMRRRVFVAGSALASVQLGSLALGVLGGCDGATTGKRIQLENRLTSDLVGGGMVNAFGWTVSISDALLCIADLVYLDGAPIAWRWADALVPSAHAHPGHYREGNVLGELHQPMLVDLMAGTHVLGVTEAVTGTARSAMLGFHDPNEDDLHAPDGSACFLAGTAEKDGVVLPFTAEAFTDELISSATKRPEVDGCVFEDGQLDADGIVTVTVQVHQWVDQIDFSLVESVGEIDLSAHEIPHNAFVRGIKKAAAYVFSYQRS